MRTIKFRGRDIETGEYVYGDLIQRNDKTLIHERGTIAAKYVEPDSVAQFTDGYDEDGNEVYEGDIVEADYFGVHYEYKASLKGFATTEDGCWIPSAKFKDCKVKGGVTNGQSELKFA